MSKTGKKVLIVDDMPTILDEAKKALGDRYDCELASSGTEAIELAKTTKPDIALIDMHMPDMNGISCMQAIHRYPELSNMPILITMNDVSVITKARAFDHGAIDFLQKPFISENMYRKIDMHLKLAEVGYSYES
ncbi:MAG: response regulator [Lachnospiraceae bacterium]|nr:response regulator [Lachnospiraceae bacterium]MDN4742346.1 response regulator [Lachnospiraceae bacterium C1.1]